MEVMYWLIPVALLLLIVAISAFTWAVKSDQYSDLESPAYKILFDDDSAAPQTKDSNVQPQKSDAVSEQSATNDKQ